MNSNWPKPHLDFSTFMKGMICIEPDFDKCEECGGLGFKPIMCCNGYECGCMGLPCDYEKCECEADPPSEERIRKAAERFDND